jgi:bla regulator protein BlaR1
MLYATIVAGLLAGAAHALEPLAAVRRWPRRGAWLAAMAALPVLALAATIRPAATDPTGAGARLGEAVAQVSPWMESLTRLDATLAAVWAGSAALLLVAYAAGAASLVARIRRWRPATVGGQQVLVAPDVGPALIGVIRPRIVVPAWALSLEAPAHALMLAHEREHLHARDPLVLHLAALAVLLVPWNLPLWWMVYRLRLAVELDCDARVLAGGGDAHRYADLLLVVGARRSGPTSMLAPALVERMSSLSRRIAAMFPVRSRFPRLRLALSAAAVCVLVAAACEAPAPDALGPSARAATLSKRDSDPITVKFDNVTVTAVGGDSLTLGTLGRAIAIEIRDRLRLAIGAPPHAIQLGDTAGIRNASGRTFQVHLAPSEE